MSMFELNDETKYLETTELILVQLKQVIVYVH